MQSPRKQGRVGWAHREDVTKETWELWLTPGEKGVVALGTTRRETMDPFPSINKQRKAKSNHSTQRENTSRKSKFKLAAVEGDCQILRVTQRTQHNATTTTVAYNSGSKKSTKFTREEPTGHMGYPTRLRGNHQNSKYTSEPVHTLSVYHKLHI
jgi:hypothetical protein